MADPAYSQFLDEIEDLDDLARLAVALREPLAGALSWDPEYVALAANRFTPYLIQRLRAAERALERVEPQHRPILAYREWESLRG